MSGESLAKAELFLFFTGIIHQFDFRTEVEGQLPPEVGLLLSVLFSVYSTVFG